MDTDFVNQTYKYILFYFFKFLLIINKILELITPMSFNLYLQIPEKINVTCLKMYNNSYKLMFT